MNTRCSTWIAITSAVALAVLAPGSIVLEARFSTSTRASSASSGVSAKSDEDPPANVTWSTNPLEVVISPGEMASRNLTLTGNRNNGGLRLCVVNIESFVKAEVPIGRGHDNDADAGNKDGDWR